MNIRFDHVIPAPLAGISFSDNSIWGNDVLLETESNYLITAPSGTGKSTFVSMLYGTRNDFSGNIFFEDRSSSSFSLKGWALVRRETLAVVFQDLRLFPDLTMLENIQLKARLAEGSQVGIKEMAAQLGIAEKLNTKCRIMSLGQLQRVAIIRALVQPFKMLLLDEPFSHLDEQNIAIASELIQEVCRKNNAGLIITSLGNPYLFNYKKSFTS
jgi:ABC-type lipoprotein export system ATPase subunit